MKGIISLFVASLLVSGLVAQTVSVTFQVDMSNETVSPNGVHIAGNFQSIAGLGSNWNPGSTPLSDDDNDAIYSITVDLPPNTYEYKFINGNNWGMDERPPGNCSVGPTNNRAVTIGNSDITLPAVPFNGCIANIKFAINMQGLPISPDGIHVMGNFQEAAGFAENWDPTSIMLTDRNGDRTYEINISLPDGDYHYLFVNGKDTSAAEMLPPGCFVLGSNGKYNRTISVTSDTPDPPTYCFNTCDECDPHLNTDFDTYWWNDAVFYEIFIRSFYDSDGDGIGDFQGIIEKLDYLNDGNPETETDLGITAIWLMPMMESPSYHGYDVTDYYAVEPDYGTMADFEEFLTEAHNRGIKVIIDLVLNHTSNQHPWFTQSAGNANNFRDWYIWSDTNPGFLGPWGQTVWHNRGGDYYYGLFWGGMPDLNYNHQPVKDELFNVVDFWLDKGVDGFRLDAIKYLIEDGTALENTPATFALLEEFNDLYKANNTEAFTIGEVWSNTASIIPYVQNDRLDVCFDFDLAGDIISAVNNQNPAGIQDQMQTMQAAYPALQYGTFLTNHDIDRVFNVIGTNTEKMKLAASIYLTLPGIPFLYYGEEVSMMGTGAHENIRRPMQWSAAANGGFSSSSPWIGLGANYTTNNVAVMESNENSLLNHYKKLIHIRNKHEALTSGNYLNITSSANPVLAFARMQADHGVLVVSNLSTQILNTSLTLPASNLSPGTYYVTDLYADQELGTVFLNDVGGFENWNAATSGLEARSTRILLLTENPVSTRRVQQDDLGFSLYPNPTRQDVTIQLDGISIQDGNATIFTANGLPVYESALTGQSLTVETGNWARGIYFVQIVGGGKMGVQRLVIL